MTQGHWRLTGHALCSAGKHSTAGSPERGSSPNLQGFVVSVAHWPHHGQFQATNVMSLAYSWLKMDSDTLGDVVSLL